MKTAIAALLILLTSCTTVRADRCSPEAYSISKGGLGTNLTGSCSPGEVPVYRADCEGFECAPGGVGPTGPTGASGGSGSTGATGPAGRLAGLEYTFSSTVGGTPASGTIRLDNADPTLATAVYVSEVAADAANYSAVLNGVYYAAQYEKGYLYLSDADGGPAFAVYRVLSATDQGSYVEFEALFESGTGSSYGTDVVVSFAPNGNDGSDVPGSSTDEAIARYNGTVGLLQDSGIKIDDTNNVTFPAGEDNALRDLHCIGFDEPEALGTGSIDFCSEEWVHDGTRKTINLFTSSGIPASGSTYYPMTIQYVDASTANIDWTPVGGDVTGGMDNIQIGSQKVGTTELVDGGVGTIDINADGDTPATGECLRASTTNADVFEWTTCLAGATGPTGPTGATGSAGATGPTGPDKTWGAGVKDTAGTISTASDETGFLSPAASLSCGAGTAGQCITLATGGGACCDNAATPTARYWTYGNGFGGANTLNVTDAASDTTTWCGFVGAAATGTQGLITDPGCTYNASTNVLDVGITDGPIDNAPVGATTPHTGKFTTLTRKAGGGTGYGSSVIDLYATSTQVGNVGGGTDDLQSYTVPASTLAVDGDHLDIEWAVKFAANANNKTFKIVFGSTTLYTIGAAAFNGTTLIGRTRLTWAVAGSQQAFTEVNPTSTNSPWSAGDAAAYATATETLTGALAIKGTGLSGSSATDDVKMLWMNVMFGNTP